MRKRHPSRSTTTRRRRPNTMGTTRRRSRSRTFRHLRRRRSRTTGSPHQVCRRPTAPTARTRRGHSRGRALVLASGRRSTRHRSRRGRTQARTANGRLCRRSRSTRRRSWRGATGRRWHRSISTRRQRRRGRGLVIQETRGRRRPCTAAMASQPRWCSRTPRTDARALFCPDNTRGILYIYNDRFVIAEGGKIDW